MELINRLTRQGRQRTLQAQPVVIILADITGYTNFLLSTRTALIHGQEIINELLEGLLKQVQMPLKVAKLEGDAVFLYAKIGSRGSGRYGVEQVIGDRVPQFFDAFSTRLNQLETRRRNCVCGACSNIHVLRLKIIVHSGHAAFYRIGRFTEIGGLDVIIAHRLLKNSAKQTQYILMTEEALRAIPGLRALPAYRHEELIPSIGTAVTYIHVIDGDDGEQPE